MPLPVGAHPGSVTASICSSIATCGSASRSGHVGLRLDSIKDDSSLIGHSLHLVRFCHAFLSTVVGWTDPVSSNGGWFNYLRHHNAIVCDCPAMVTASMFFLRSLRTAPQSIKPTFVHLVSPFYSPGCSDVLHFEILEDRAPVDECDGKLQAAGKAVGVNESSH